MTRKKAGMRNQQDRDTVKVDIFTTLLIFASVMAVGASPSSW